MPEFDVCFSTREHVESGSYRFLELPPELHAIVQNLDDEKQSFSIRGRLNDDAVLCTPDKTFQLRSVTLSNSLCVMRPPQGSESGHIYLRDTVQEILELVPTIPKLHRLGGLLRGCEYDEQMEQEDNHSEVNAECESPQPTKRPRYTYADIKSEIQASDLELDRGLKAKHILNLNGHLRPISPGYLSSILELLLTTLVSLSLSPSAAPALDLADTLENDHDIRRVVSMQVMSWFGELTGHLGKHRFSSDTKWTMDMDSVVKQIGLGILRDHRENPIAELDFLEKWRATVGNTFESRVDLSLLLGNYLSHPSPSSVCPVLSFFPASSLPITPTERFTDLFLTRLRWNAEDIVPFLNDIALNGKERDKLLMKYARSTTDKDGVVWYTARGGIAS